MKSATTTVAPKTDPKPTASPFKKDKPKNFHGCFRTCTNSRSFSLRISLLRSLTSFASWSSVVWVLGLRGDSFVFFAGIRSG